jgi:hypothetical protein
MGADIGVGIIFGIPIDELVTELAPKFIDRKRYDTYTGEEYFVPGRTDIVRCNFNFGPFKKGEEVDENDIKNYLEELEQVEEENHPRKYSKDYVDYPEFELSYRYVGYKASLKSDLYESPQDMCKDYIPDPRGEKAWKESFPEVPGRLLIYCHYSY